MERTFDQIQADQRKLEAEKKARLENIRNQIWELCNTEGLYCGVSLTHEDLINLFKLAMENKDTIKIPFDLHFK